MRSHDLSSRAIILTHQVLSNGRYGVSVRAHWAEIERKKIDPPGGPFGNFDPPGGHFGIKTGEISFFFHRCQRPARRPARPPSRALASMKKKKKSPSMRTFMANLWPIHGHPQKKNHIWPYIWPYMAYIFPTYWY